MLSWRSTDISRVEQACDKVARALLSPAATSKNTNTNNQDAASTSTGTSGSDSYPPFISEPCGSFPLRTAAGYLSNNTAAINPENNNGTLLYNADIVFEIPEDLCDKKDVENGLYLEKRDEMMQIAFKRIQSNMMQQQNAENNNNNQHQLVPTQASLEFQPGSGNQKRFIRVIFSTSSNISKTPVAIISVYCRPRHAGIVNSAKGIKAPKYATTASSWYGSLVVEDLVMPRFAKQHADINNRSAAFAVAAQLLRKWATSCVGVVGTTGSNVTGGNLLAGGLNLFAVVTAPMLLLLNENTITPSSNVDAMIRAVWIYWSKYATLNSGVSVDAATSAPSAISLVIPSEPYLNIFHRVLANNAASTTMIDSLVALGEAAAGALKIGGSIETLLSPIATLGSSIFERFDAVIRVGIQSKSSGSKYLLNDQNQQALCGQLQSKLKAALLSRSNAVVVGFAKSNAYQDSQNSGELTVAIEFSSEPAARSRLFKGPVIDDKKGCAEFETLWGSQYITTRQFADGSINRCVVVPHPLGDKVGNAKFDFADPCSGLRSVCDAVEILVTRHVDLLNVAAAAKNNKKNSAKTNSDDASPTDAASSGFSFTSSFELCSGAEYLSALFQLDATSSVARDPEPFVATLRADAIEAIREKINEIAESSLPCKVIGVEFVSPAERGTDPFPPLPHISILTKNSNIKTWCSNSSSLHPIHAVIQIEDKKNKIPDNIEAIAQLKSVLLAQVAKGFQNNQKQEYSAHVSRAFCDVLHHESGFMFRFSVLFEREILVLQQSGKEAEATNLSRSMVWSQRHANFMRSTVLVQHASAAGACRLLRKWVCSMCLGDYIPAEVTELIIAFVYMSNTRLLTRAFCSAQTAFIAAIRLLASFPFETTPLVFPEVDSDRAYLIWRDEVRKQNAAQSQNKAPAAAQRAMFIAAPYTEPDHSPFTEMTPRRGVMQVLQRCAGAAVSNILCGNFGNVFTLDNSAAFTFSLVGTDAASEKFSLNPAFAPAGSNSAITSRVMPKIAALSDAEAASLLGKTVETNAFVSAVKTLRRQFRDRCMIFYDEHSPTSINGIEFGNFSTFNKKNKVSSLPQEMFAAVASSNVLVAVSNNNNNNNNNNNTPSTTQQQQQQTASATTTSVAPKKQQGKNIVAVAGKKKGDNGNGQKLQQEKPAVAAAEPTTKKVPIVGKKNANNSKINESKMVKEQQQQEEKIEVEAQKTVEKPLAVEKQKKLVQAKKAKK